MATVPVRAIGAATIDDNRETTADATDGHADLSIPVAGFRTWRRLIRRWKWLSAAVRRGWLGATGWNALTHLSLESI